MEITRNWRFFIGIDISKKWLDIHLFDRKTSSRDEVHLANTTTGFQRLGQWLTAQQVGPSKSVLVSEHTGPTENSCYDGQLTISGLMP